MSVLSSDQASCSRANGPARSGWPSDQLTIRRSYSRAERFSDAVVHVVGVALAVIAVPVLLALAMTWTDDPGTMIAVSVYGTTLIAMLGCSALYNMTHGCAWTDVFRRMDHTAIYLKIAGTYTPFAVLAGPQARPLLVGVWAAAALGAGMKILAPERFRLLAIGLCLIMGWAGLAFGEDMVARLSPAAYSLILTGGLIYTAGVAFYLWGSLPYHMTIWHVLVLMASGIIYAAVVIELGTTHPATMSLLQSAAP